MRDESSKQHRPDGTAAFEAPGSTQGFPVQPPYHGLRSDTAALDWEELNALPTGWSTRRGLGTC
ncbi:hypothetical protein ABT336_05180 [Micromonospora sp. NPDC000207]|uniref:hypothetical protein n=1 Tax=Micromonospora sp. NPDC000207 TaxID=3154246 RepID=UPI00331D7D85